MSHNGTAKSLCVMKTTSRKGGSALSEDQPLVVRTGPIARRAWSLSFSGSRAAPRARDLVRGGSYTACACEDPLPETRLQLSIRISRCACAKRFAIAACSAASSTTGSSASSGTAARVRAFPLGKTSSPSSSSESTAERALARVCARVSTPGVGRLRARVGVRGSAGVGVTSRFVRRASGKRSFGANVGGGL